jgi:hypothetical protein
MECSVANDNHWEGEMTLNPADNLYYCPKHVSKCAAPECEKKFFDCELGADFSYGANCVSCPGEYTPYWCDDHIPNCHLCEERGHLCESCAWELTNGTISSLCEGCCEVFLDNSRPGALTKRAR